MKQVFLTILIHMVTARSLYRTDPATLYESIPDGLDIYKYAWRFNTSMAEPPSLNIHKNGAFIHENIQSLSNATESDVEFNKQNKVNQTPLISFSEVAGHNTETDKEAANSEIDPALNSLEDAKNEVDSNLETIVVNTSTESSRDIISWLATYRPELLSNEGVEDETQSTVSFRPTEATTEDNDDKASGLDIFEDVTGIEFPNRVGKPVITTLQGPGR